MNFADAINAGTINKHITRCLNEINECCRKNPNNPRDAGVVNPQLFIQHPLKLVSIDLEDNEIGTITVDSYWGTKTAQFSADDDIEEFCQMDLMEAMQ